MKTETAPPENTADDTQQPKSANEPYKILMKATQEKKTSLVRETLQKNDKLSTDIALHEAAFAAGVEIYGIFLDKFPDLVQHTFSHRSDPIGEAVTNDDLAMVEMLLSRGVQLKHSHYCYVPVSPASKFLLLTL